MKPPQVPSPVCLVPKPEMPDRVVGALPRAVQDLLEIHRDVGEVVERIAGGHRRLNTVCEGLEHGVVRAEVWEGASDAGPHRGVIGAGRLRVLLDVSEGSTVAS